MVFGPQSQFFKLQGYIKHIYIDEKMIYLSCPVCRKKVIEDKPGFWRCESCNMTHTTNLPTYMLSAVFADVSGQMNLAFPRELGNNIMDGYTASEFKDLRDSGENIKEFINS